MPKPSTPVNGAPVNGFAVNTPAAPAAPAPSGPPAAAPGSMAPPPRDRPTDVADLNDVLASSGIDVRDEEAYLTQGYGQPAPAPAPPPHQPPRLQTAFNNSFASQASAGTLTPGSSFQQTTFQAYTPSSAHGAAPPRPPLPAPQRSAEEIAADLERREDTYMSRRAAYHLQKPYLQTRPVENRLSFLSNDRGVKLPTMGVFRPVPDNPQGQGQSSSSMTVEVVGPDNSTKLSTGATLLNYNATLGDIISLLSLACQDRFRGVVDYAATMAKNRQVSSQGIPNEWADLAVVKEAAAATETTATDGVTANGGTKRTTVIWKYIFSSLLIN